MGPPPCPGGRRDPQIRTQGSYVRKCLSTRDRGQCSECGIDAAGLYKRARAAWISGDSMTAKRRAVALEMVGTPFEGKVKHWLRNRGEGVLGGEK